MEESFKRNRQVFRRLFSSDVYNDSYMYSIGLFNRPDAKTFILLTYSKRNAKFDKRMDCVPVLLGKIFGKKQFIITVVIPIICVLFGCSSMSVTGISSSLELYKAVESQSRSYSRLYKYKQNDVFNAIVYMLENKFHVYPDAKLTTIDTIFTSAGQNDSKPSWPHTYLFNLKKIDDENTEVSLKALTAQKAISEKVMLNKYLIEELEYLYRKAK